MGVVKSPVPYLPKTDAPSNVNFRRIKQGGYPNIWKWLKTPCIYSAFSHFLLRICPHYYIKTGQILR